MTPATRRRFLIADVISTVLSILLLASFFLTGDKINLILALLFWINSEQYAIRRSQTDASST